jgi:hypothetical protein
VKAIAFMWLSVRVQLVAMWSRAVGDPAYVPEMSIVGIFSGLTVDPTSR